jgi:hypothetical protein
MTTSRTWEHIMIAGRRRSLLLLVTGVVIGAAGGVTIQNAMARGKKAGDEVVSIAVARGGTVYRAWKSGRIDVCPDDGSRDELCRGSVSRTAR